MWTFKLFSLAALVYLPSIPSTEALTLHKRENPAVLALPINKRSDLGTLQKRGAKVVNVELDNMINLRYFVNLTVGSPGQDVMLSIDTGSSDMWVNVPNSDYCSQDGDPCALYGLFNPKKSSTFKQLDYKMNATYLAGTLAVGHYATDKVKIGGATIKKAQFAVAEDSQLGNGILGIGYKASTYAAAALSHMYPNLPQSLVDSGAIKSAAYSLWLNEFDAVGSILFGGVNKARYEGELQTLPVVPVRGRYQSLTLALTEIIVEGSKDSTSVSKGMPLATTLDNGSPLIELPQEIVDPVLRAVGARYSSKYDLAYIDCDEATSDYNVTFSFSGAKISVPMNALVFPSKYRWEGLPSDECLFGIKPGQPGFSLIGDPFMRSAYIVYDLDNNEISLAQAKFNSGDDDIHEIGTGSDAVPGAKKVASAVSSATGNGPNPTEVPDSSEATPTIVVTESATQTAAKDSPTGPTGTGTAPASSTSSGLATFPTMKPQFLLPGAVGAGLLLAL
ncbi:hypothetical protein PDE_07930 [Penicillium oxalicum 114-2]|uniref:Peptidase A1 domain-containing protein n=1 Tax=Penicillium oxalicum (strain 114-2 / CGMCC 5302) TaxID=933388 RepID=S7ZRC5_PENO1|nr:hypothetical protein PDE_07930 [Penicillium oxalicum 114-2]